MKPYTVALTVLFRLVAVALVFYTIYGWIVSLLMPMGFGGLIGRLSIINLVFAAFFYFRAPFLARLITAGED